MHKNYSIAREFSVQCLCCGKQIPYGRADKKFCTVECKNKFHNMQKVSLKLIKQDIRRHVERNYRILLHLTRIPVTAISLQQVTDMGFDVRYITKTEAIGGLWKFYCYDICYQVDERRLYHIEHSASYQVDLTPANLFDDEGDDCC